MIAVLFGVIAQLVEQLTLNQRAAGSSPAYPIEHEKDSDLCPLL